MNVKTMLAALAMGSAIVISGAAYAADKDTKPAKADDAPAATAAPAAPAAPAGKPIRLVKPWGDITSLSEEQRAKIDAIHKKALAEINVIEKREKEEIEALLTDVNRAEMKDQADQKKKNAAAKRAAAKK